jgi:hypothetical protein
VPERVEILTPAASPEEAAAVMAAIQQFRRDHALTLVAAAPAQSGWQRAALLEGTGREPDAPSPWGDPVPWGR